MWALRNAATITLLAISPLLCVVAQAVVTAHHFHPMDFLAFRDSGIAFLHGRSPYVSLADLPHHANRTTFAPFVYPAPAAAAMVPFGLLPVKAAVLLWFALSVAAVGLALWVLDVRDWRAYGAAYVSIPALAGFGNGALSPMLLLGVALAWRYRDRAVVCGLAVAAVIVAKMFLWPLGLWLLLTRRWRAAGVAAATGAVALAGAWAAIGFAGFRDYPALISRLTGLVGPNSYSPYAAARALGVGGAAAQAVPMLLAVVLMWIVRKRTDRTVVTVAVGAALFATPILWPHYLVLLFVPIALASRRLGPAWLLMPLALWLDPRPWSYGRLDRILPELGIVAATLAWPYAASTARTSSAWVSGFTFRMTRLMLPSSAITNVERSTPM